MSKNNNTDYSAIILAAGSSSRFGSNKFLAIIEDQPLILHTISAFREIVKPQNLVVVLGKDAKLIIPYLEKKDVRFVVNEEYTTGGMSLSIRTGLEYLQEYGSLGNSLFIHPGDVPYVQITDLIELQKHDKKQSGIILIPTFRGKRGHPLLLPNMYFEELFTISDQTLGLKSLRNTHKKHIQYVEVENEGITYDVDTAEDLKQLLAKFQFHS